MAYQPYIHHRRSIRLKGYDYGQAGVYFITICTHERSHLFGEIRKGEMQLNALGQIAYQEWLKTPEIRSTVILDVFIIMPNHLHGIILITDQNSITDEPHGSQPNIPFKSPSNSIGAIVRGYKTAVTKQINTLRVNSESPVWQRNYHEHIIQNERAYQNISEYIINNPITWEMDRFYS